MPTDTTLAPSFLRSLGLRQTPERLAAAALLLNRPGITATLAAHDLAGLGQPVDLRTIQRLLRIFRSPEGCLARFDALGPQWVCWACCRVVGDARAVATAVAPSRIGYAPIDFGGYCGRCTDQLPMQSGPPGAKNRPITLSVAAARRAPLIPIGSLYANSNLMREIVGSNRRVVGRDFAIAVLAEHPAAGPTDTRRLLDEELANPPSLRSVKRYCSSMRSPKAQMLFALTGMMGWSCIPCTKYGQVSDVRKLQREAPDGFTPTDVRGVCVECHLSANRTCRMSDK